LVMADLDRIILKGFPGNKYFIIFFINICPIFRTFFEI